VWLYNPCSRSGLTPIVRWRSVNVQDEKSRRSQTKPRNRVHRRNCGARAVDHPILRAHLRLFEHLSERRGNSRFRRELPPHSNLNELEFRNRVVPEIVQPPRASRSRNRPARFFAIPGSVGRSNSSIPRRTNRPFRVSSPKQKRSLTPVSSSLHKYNHPSPLKHRPRNVPTSIQRITL
jgi:hypothetical protein